MKIPVLWMAGVCVSWMTASPALHAALERIKWSDTPVLIQEGGNYGRITRLDRKTLLASFDWRRAVHVRHSRDEGKTWEPPVKVVDWPFGAVTNAELLVLKNGEVLCFFNRRPGKREGAGQAFSIAVCRSTDGGKTWGEPSTVYEAGKEFENGCWEPVGLQMPDGEVHVYFANEGPFRESDEQEISLMRSADNGKTWGKAERISFRKRSRDGMPVPVLTGNGKTIAMAIEDNGLSGTFKPVIIATRALKGGWSEPVADGSSSRRWGALAKPLEPQVYAGAPYLRQLPDGSFVLSFQQAESGDMKHSRMAVCIGNDSAKKFGQPSFPFAADNGKAQLWNALFIKSANTITAISQTSQNGVQGIWAVDGRCE